VRPAAVAAPLAAAGAAVVAWGTWIEPRRLVVRHPTLRLPRWPVALDGLRVALVSDLHAGAPHVDEQRVARVADAVQDERPDLVCLLGDFIDWKVTFARPVGPEAVAAPFGALRAPLGVVAVLGNHDWRTDGPRVAAALRDAGVTVLENDAVEAGDGARRLWVAGVEDPSTRIPDVAAAVRSVPDGEPLLILSHDPDLFPAIPERVALTLSGHTHGGQINLPPLRRHVIPSIFGDRYARGHIVERDRHLYVTSGVGTSSHPVRLGRPPEIVVLTLRSAPAAA
jgi:predicted MPP superfamily phosphohydrolase